MKKKILSLLVICALIMSVSTVAVAVTDSNQVADDGVETMGMLTLGDQGIRIYAKVADINAYFDAKTDAEKEKVLSAMMNNSDNKVVSEQVAYTNAETFHGPCEYVSLESEDTKNQTSQQTEQEEWGVLNVVDQTSEFTRR